MSLSRLLAETRRLGPVGVGRWKDHRGGTTYVDLNWLVEGTSGAGLVIPAIFGIMLLGHIRGPLVDTQCYVGDSSMAVSRLYEKDIHLSELTKRMVYIS